LTEYIFNITNQNPSAKKTDGTSLPSSEASRREDIQKLQVSARLFINGN